MSDTKYGVVIPEFGVLPKDEPQFVLRGQDRFAATAIILYAELVKAVAVLSGDGKLYNQATAALRTGLEMQDWQRQNPSRVKQPD